MALPSIWKGTTPPLASGNARLLQWLNETVEGISNSFEVLRRTPADGVLTGARDESLSLTTTPQVIPLEFLSYQVGFEVDLTANDITALVRVLAEVDFRLTMTDVGFNGSIIIGLRVNAVEIGTLTIPTTNQSDTFSTSGLLAGLVDEGDVIDFTLARGAGSGTHTVALFDVKLVGRPV